MVVQLKLPTVSFHFVTAKEGGWMLSLPSLHNHRSLAQVSIFHCLIPRPSCLFRQGDYATCMEVRAWFWFAFWLQTTSIQYMKVSNCFSKEMSQAFSLTYIYTPYLQTRATARFVPQFWVCIQTWQIWLDTGVTWAWCLGFTPNWTTYSNRYKQLAAILWWQNIQTHWIRHRSKYTHTLTVKMELFPYLPWRRMRGTEVNKVWQKENKTT